MVIPVTQNVNVFVENHKLPKFMTLFKNSACVSPNMKISEADELNPALYAIPLLAAARIAVSPTVESKNSGGSELNEYSESSHSCES